MPTAGWTHDITIESVGGTPKLGFMLAKRNGKRQFAIRDYPTIAPRTLTMGEMTEAEMPSELERIWKQENWQAGMGWVNDRIGLGNVGIAKGYLIDTTSPSGIIRVSKTLNATTVTIANPDDYRPAGFAIVGTEVWAFMGQDCYQWDYTNKHWDWIQEATTAVGVYARNGVEFGGNTYAPRWRYLPSAGEITVTYLYKADADATWTTSSLSNVDFKYMAVADNKLWGGYQATNKHQIKSSTDGTSTGSWTAATSVGTSDAEITALITYNDILLVCKTDGLWTANASGTVKQLYDMRGQQHPDNFRGAISWDSGKRVLLPLGAGGLLELYNDSVRDISFSKTMPDQSFVHGVVTALAAEATYVFALVHESANTRYHLMMGELVAIGADLDYRWHHVGVINYTTGTEPEMCALFAEGVPSGSTIHHRIWAGVYSSGSSLLPYFFTLTNDAEDTYSAGGGDAECVSVTLDFGMPRLNKRFSSIDFTTANLGTGATAHYYEVQYRVDGGSWTYVTGTQSTSKLTTTPQTLTFAAGITGKKIELRFLPTRGSSSTTTSPEILDFTLKAQIRPGAIKSFPIPLYLADGMTLRNGARSYTTLGDLDQLKDWDNQAAEVVLRTIEGGGSESYNCIFLPGTMRLEEVGARHGRRPEYLVMPLLAVV